MAGSAAQQVPAAGAREAAGAPNCAQDSSEPAAATMPFRLGETVQAMPAPVPGGAGVLRYASMWPDAVALAPSGAPVLIVLSAQQAEMHVLDRESGSLLKKIPLYDRTNRQLSYAGAVVSRFRRSILVRFDQPELWELFLTADGPAIYEGLVHDYRMGEGLPEPSQYPVRRIPLDAPVTAMVAEPGHANLIFTQIGADGIGRLVRFNLDVRRPIGQIETRSPRGKLSLGRSGDIDFVMLESAGDVPDVFKLPDLKPLDWRKIPAGKCRAR